MENNNHVLLDIKKQFPHLNPALKKIGNFILNHPEQAKALTIKELAGNCQVAEATVTRFVKELNYTNFQELKIAIAEQLSQARFQKPKPNEKQVYEDINRGDSNEEVIDKIIFRNLEVLKDTQKTLETSSIKKAVDAIEKCDLITFFCSGSSVISAENAVFRFYRLGKKCVFHRDWSLQGISAVATTENNLVIGISNSGRTIPTVDALKLAKERGATTIAITSFPDSPIVKYSDIQLYTPDVPAALGSSLFHESMISKMAQILVVDILYACYAVRNFDHSIEELENSYSTFKDSRYK